MTEHSGGSLGKFLKMSLHIREQELKIAALMIMRHVPSRDPPEPLNAIGIGIISRRVDQVQLLLQLAEHAAHEQRPCGRMSPEIIRNDNGDTPTILRASNGCPHLLAEGIGGTSRSNPAIEPAIAPIYQTKAVDLAIVPRGLDQTLPTTPFAAPDPGEGWVKGKLDRILQIEVGLR